MRTFELSAAELALLVQHMTGGEVMPDPALEADLDAADDQLHERGLLVQAPLEDEAGVASRLAIVLNAALAPGTLGILRVERPPATTELSYFSVTAECVARNFLRDDGCHVFEMLESLDDAIGLMTADAPDRADTESTSVALADLLSEGATVAVLLVVYGPAQPDPPTRALSWTIARGRAWLVDRAADDGVALATSVTPAELRASVRASLQYGGTM